MLESAIGHGRATHSTRAHSAPTFNLQNIARVKPGLGSKPNTPVLNPVDTRAILAPLVRPSTAATFLGSKPSRACRPMARPLGLQSLAADGLPVYRFGKAGCACGHAVNAPTKPIDGLPVCCSQPRE
jgi:hypothetical protein